MFIAGQFDCAVPSMAVVAHTSHSSWYLANKVLFDDVAQPRGSYWLGRDRRNNEYFKIGSQPTTQKATHCVSTSNPIIVF